jgi:hypothetical protein
MRKSPMNDRIRKLAEQARQYATTRHPISNIVLACDSYVFEQKFAELIVRDCGEFCGQDDRDAMFVYFGVEE